MCLVLSSLAELCKQSPCSAAPKMNLPFPRLQLLLQCEQQDAERTVVISCTSAECVLDRFPGPSVWKGASNTLAVTGSWLWSVETPPVNLHPGLH